MSSKRTSHRRPRRGVTWAEAKNKPPQFKSNIIVNHTYRFTSSNATTTAVTPTSLLGAAGTICTVANTRVVSMFQAVKVNSVKMWAPPPSQGSAATCSIEWIGTVSPFLANLEVSDTSNSTATPATVRSVPPRQSLASFWQQASNNSLFFLTAPVGTIIDVSMSLILYDDDVTTPLQIAVTTGTAEYSYYLSLDPVGTHRYVPVSLTTTF